MPPTSSYITLLAVAGLLVGCPSTTGGDTSASGTDSESDGSISTTTVDSTDPSTSSTTDDSTSSTGSTTEEPTTETTGGDCQTDEDCANESFCDGEERCEGGACVAGDPVECVDNDDLECTSVACDDERGACVILTDHSMCECGETCHPELGCGNHCTPVICQGNQPYQCGDCIDNDGDCLIDAMDPNCWGPCDNNESGWHGDVSGQQNQSECNVMDCYFDNNSGTGNDNCYWSHTCDPLQPTWHDDSCEYDPEYSPPGSGGADCADLLMSQTEQCTDVYCGPLTPNGCDCFGCCEITLSDDTTTTIYLGSTDEAGNFTCNYDTREDPQACHECTQVPSCINPCDPCEICIGQPELPPECEEQECPEGLQQCGLPGQDPCPANQGCITGCCVPQPQ
jgi:hypothetical protein